MADTTRKLFIKSYGCQMNVYDSARMSDMLAPAGYVETDQPDDADLIILNTCHIREKAAEKVYSELGRIRKIKAERADEGQDVKIAVAGCVAQAFLCNIVFKILLLLYLFLKRAGFVSLLLWLVTLSAKGLQCSLLYGWLV